MKTSNVLIRLFILGLLFTPFLTTTEATAQTCGGATPCGVFPNCYAAPKVACPAQLSHLITSSCNAATSAGLCDPGVFICVSSTLPTGTSCGCGDSAQSCKYVNIRNLIDCAPGSTPPQNASMDTIELRITKDANSSKYVICGPLKQWGASPWTSAWTIAGGRTNGTCYNWNSDTQLDIKTYAPSSSYTIDHLNHWSTVVCGANTIEIRIHYTSGNWSNWFTNLTVNTTNCPDGGSDHGWCP